MSTKPTPKDRPIKYVSQDYVMARVDLPVTTRIVAYWIISTMNIDNISFHGQDTIAALIGRERRTVERCVAELKAAKIIDVGHKRRDGGKWPHCYYRLTSEVKSLAKAWDAERHATEVTWETNEPPSVNNDGRSPSPSDKNDGRSPPPSVNNDGRSEGTPQEVAKPDTFTVRHFLQETRQECRTNDPLITHLKKPTAPGAVGDDGNGEQPSDKTDGRSQLPATSGVRALLEEHGLGRSVVEEVVASKELGRAAFVALRDHLGTPNGPAFDRLWNIIEAGEDRNEHR